MNGTDAAPGGELKGPGTVELEQARRAASGGCDEGLEHLLRLTEHEIDAALRDGADCPRCLRAIDGIIGVTSAYLRARGSGGASGDGRESRAMAEVRAAARTSKRQSGGDSAGPTETGRDESSLSSSSSSMPEVSWYDAPPVSERGPNPLVLWQVIELVEQVLRDLGFQTIGRKAAAGWGAAYGWEESDLAGGGAGLWTGEGPWGDAAGPGSNGGAGAMDASGSGPGSAGAAAGAVGGASWAFRAAVRGAAV